ncbi:hypothetical protein FNH13_08855 [Ornithinimicrobium ciconiae]|uniref:PKD domain-containing protein n=1 Tax=Ornithinimicrobium ciconiae TaxID=2594265 RepID=A0A516GA84_9MICO|nr:hypothetical protein [Ornithinimicrobium ciconiae]QDO88436.1 hypothetical protein FNH13_08855 [Ornithinimicrobium ciconiae]
MADVYPSGSSPDNPERWFEYVAVIACRGNGPDAPDRVNCQFAISYCDTFQPGSSGPYSYIHRRVADDSGPLGTWEPLGPTCFRTDVPARSGESAPELTEAMILEQFHRTDFALPTMSIEPPDGRTLVNLPVFYELVWPDEGYEPGEIDTTDIIGFEVRIRPTLDSATYHFGDGTSAGPTTSLGGPHPNGDITHEYANAATVDPHITVVYGGEVSVDGGAWSTIPGTATIDGPLNPLEVLTSRNRLYDD